MTYKYTTISLMIIIIVGLAARATFLSFGPQNAPSPSARLLPDAFMEEVTTFVMDKEGKPSMKIMTPKMVHFAENDTTQLTSPQLTLYRKSPKPWYVTANHAKATEGVENVHFWDQVEIHHAADENNPATVIKTPTLMVHPNKQTAETDRMVTLIQPNLTVKAIGMNADLNSGDIRLLSQARGEYVPSS